LERRWNDSLTHFTYILLNPSSAGATEDDGTTRKLFQITRANGGGSYELVNIFALVDTAQTCLRHPSAVGETHEANDWWIGQVIARSQKLVAGWGDGMPDDAQSGGRQATILKRARAVLPMIGDRPMWCVVMNRSHSPRHPGRGIRNDAGLVRYTPPIAYTSTISPQAATAHPREYDELHRAR
jgi:hypothetical protein